MLTVPPILPVLQVVINAPEVSFTVTSTVSVPGSVPSEAVSVRVNVVSAVTAGAVKVVEAEALSSKVISESEGADHVYDTPESSSSG